MENKSELKIGALRMIIGAVLLVLIVVLYLKSGPPEGSSPFAFETDNLWKAMHPFRFWDGLGIALLIFCALTLFGLTEWVMGKLFIGRAGALPWAVPIAGIAGVLGILCIFAL